MPKRTTHRSTAGKKLYAVRDKKTGKLEDIQTYERAHAQDIKRRAKAELTIPRTLQRWAVVTMVAEGDPVFAPEILLSHDGMRSTGPVTFHRTEREAMSEAKKICASPKPKAALIVRTIRVMTRTETREAA